jgi:hypothetical protein
MEINMVLLSPDWIAFKIHQSRSDLAFAVLAVVVLSGLAVLSVAFGVETLDPPIFAAP